MCCGCWCWRVISLLGRLKGFEGMTTIETLAAEVGLHVSTWSPGDGVTRYRFFRNPGNQYNGPDNGIKTVLGRKDALLWLSGVREGQDPYYQ